MAGKDIPMADCLNAHSVRIIVLSLCLLLAISSAHCQDHTATTTRPFTFVELNCENLFDNSHDTLKQDTEWLDDSPRKWRTKA